MTSEAVRLIDPYLTEYTGAGPPQPTTQGLCLPFAATAIVGLMMWAGTGGVLSSQPLPSSIAGRAFPTGATCQIRYAPQRRRDPSNDEDAAPSAVTVVLTELQEQFAFNISELSAVLQVSRPTVYSWIRGEVEPRGRSLQRIGSLKSLVEKWRLTSSQPIRAALRANPLERSKFIELLTKQNIAPSDVIYLLSGVGATTRRPLGLRERRSSPRSAEARQRSFSEETGA